MADNYFKKTSKVAAAFEVFFFPVIFGMLDVHVFVMPRTYFLTFASGENPSEKYQTTRAGGAEAARHREGRADAATAIH